MDAPEFFIDRSLGRRLVPAALERGRAVEAENRRVVERLGGMVRSSELAVLVTAQFR